MPCLGIILHRPLPVWYCHMHDSHPLIFCLNPIEPAPNPKVKAQCYHIPSWPLVFSRRSAFLSPISLSVSFSSPHSYASASGQTLSDRLQTSPLLDYSSRSQKAATKSSSYLEFSLWLQCPPSMATIFWNKSTYLRPHRGLQWAPFCSSYATTHDSFTHFSSLSSPAFSHTLAQNNLSCCLALKIHSSSPTENSDQHNIPCITQICVISSV